MLDHQTNRTDPIQSKIISSTKGKEGGGTNFSTHLYYRYIPALLLTEREKERKKEITREM